MRNRSSVIMLCLILAVALGLRLWGIGNGLPLAQVTDETEDISASLRIASGGAPNYYYIRVGWNLTEWAALGPYFVALKLTRPSFSTADFEHLYFTERGNFILLVRILTALLMTFAVALVYLIGRAITGSERGGLVTSLLMAIQPSAVYLSHVALSDNLAVLGVTLALLGSVYIIKSGKWWAYALGGLGVSLAMLGHLQSGTVVMAVMLAHGAYWYQQPGRPSRLLLTGWLWAGFAFALSQVILNPYIVLNTQAVINDIQFIIGERFSTSLDVGQRISTIGVNLPLPLITMRAYFAAAALLGLVVAVLRINASIVIIAVTLLVSAASILPAPGPRITFWLQITVPTVILSGYAITTLTQSKINWQRWIGLVTAVAVCALALSECLLIDHALSQTNTRMQAYDYMAQNVPAGTKVMMGDPFAYSVPLGRTSESMSRMQQKMTLPPSYAYLIKQGIPGPQTQYNVFGVEFQPDITDDATWWAFVRSNHVQYVVEADYCGGQSRYDSTSDLEFPVISPAVRPQLTLVKTFSPFATDSCEQRIENRTSMELLNLNDWQRVGPLVRIYAVPPENAATALK